MRLNRPRKRSRDTDGNDITGIGKLESHVEARLHDAAGFEPEEEPAYDFIAVALRHRRGQRASYGSLFVTGLAGMGAAVVLAFVAAILTRGQTDAGAGLLPTLKGYEANPSAAHAAQNAAHITTAHAEERSGPRDATTPASVDMAAGRAAGDGGARIVTARQTHRRWAADREGRRAHAPAAEEEAPVVQWKTESVERSTTGVLTSGWVLHQDAEHGGVTATPVTLDVPLHTGETPAAGGKAAPRSLTLGGIGGDEP